MESDSCLRGKGGKVGVADFVCIPYVPTRCKGAVTVTEKRNSMKSVLYSSLPITFFFNATSVLSRPHYSPYFAYLLSDSFTDNKYKIMSFYSGNGFGMGVYNYNINVHYLAVKENELRYKGGGGG